MSRCASFGVVVFGCSLAACGGAAVEAAPPGPAPAAPAAVAVVAAPAAGPRLPLVTVVKGIAVSNKADHFTRATVTFQNPGGVPCTVSSYTLVWPGGRKTIGLDKFVVAPGATEVRAIRVHASDGDITTLVSTSDTHAEIESDCQ